MIQPFAVVLRVLFVSAAAGVCVAAVSDDPAAKASRPNVLLIMADDMGFSDAGCYGGEIATPTLDALAAGGLRFTQHYSTGRCWPSRAAILTGYYAQQVGRDAAPGIAGGAGGKRPDWAVLLPAALRPLGYRSYHSGKWHIDGDAKTAGFDRSAVREGSGADWDRYWATARWTEGDLAAPIEKGEPYYATVAIADHAIACLKLHERDHADKPFFQYVAFYAPHFPLHATAQDIGQYRDAYTAGWDAIRQRRWQRMKKIGIVDCALSDREEQARAPWSVKPDDLTRRIGAGEEPFAVAWDTLTDEQKRFQATKMAIHAAMVTRMDAEIGRIVEQLRASGQLDNTLILFMSDNGASAEQLIRGDGHDPTAPLGSAKSFVCLGPGWSTAANTPFRFHKHWNHEGGISSPLIAHWPAGIKAKGELRHDPTHFIDIAPTILQLAGGDWPHTYKGDATPTHPGLSLVPEFAADGAVRHESLWWCHEGNRAIRMGDWKLVHRIGTETWELYDLSADRCEMHNLAGQYPDRVKAMDARWNQTLKSF